jgi:chemotaxis family two-component system sensor kinase Cph1
MKIVPGDAVPAAPSLLQVCDREPIHIPGSIQPHGLLLVGSATTLEIIGGAGDINRRLAPNWVGQSLTEILGQTIPAEFVASGEGATLPLGQVCGTSELFDVVAHRTAEWLLIELEPAAGLNLSAASILGRLKAANRTFERAGDLRDLCERAAAAFRLITGFDRVMVYRFLDDEAGVVLGEDRDPALASFLNHHFPASDIPAQARALYVRNRVRVIPDVGYKAAPIVSASSDLAALDMSDLALRSVSPIHIQYLKNMDVAASASVSIVMDGVLWGLIACHSRSPSFLPFDVRLACDALADSLSRQIRALDEAGHYRERIRLRSLEDVVASRLGAEVSLEKFFATTGDELRGMLAADGFAAVQGADLYVAGICPDDADIRRIANWAEPLGAAKTYSTHELCKQLPEAAAYRSQASGLLATTMSTEQPTVLLWFRAEQLELVNWAGNPHKSASMNPQAPLTPRSSFEDWSQAVRGKSRPWSLLEIESADRLMRTIFDARQNRRVRDLNRDLTATVADNDRLLLQKDFLLKEVSHRIQNSLQLVSAFLSLQARDVGDPILTAHLGEAQRRIAAVGLVHRRLYGDAQLETVDLSRYIDDLVPDIQASMGANWKDQITLRLSPIVVTADKAIKIGLILTELVINANKYAYAGAPGPISIVLERHGNRLRLIVADNGLGRAGSRRGFGSKMVAIMVKGIDGAYEETSNDPGVRIIVTSPIE